MIYQHNNGCYNPYAQQHCLHMLLLHTRHYCWSWFFVWYHLHKIWYNYSMIASYSKNSQLKQTYWNRKKSWSYCLKIHDLLAQHWLLQSVCSTIFPVHAAPPHSASCLVLILCLVPLPQVLVQLLHDCQLSHKQSSKTFAIMIEYNAVKSLLRNLLEQHWVLQFICSILFPEQAVPPHNTSCTLLRLLSLVPLPQLLVQLLQDCQVPHKQSTK